MAKLIGRLLALWILISRLRGAKGGSGSMAQTSTEAQRRSARPAASDRSSTAESPLDLPSAGWRSIAKRAAKDIKRDRVTLVAAGMSYYLFLAIFPAIIAAVGILGLLDVGQGVIDDVGDSVAETMPGGAGQLLTDAIRAANEPSENASLIAAIVGIAVALWSASSGMVALQAGLDVAYDIERERKFLKARGVALLLIVATGALGGVPSPFFTLGESTIFVVLGWILTIVAVVLLFSLYYYLGPNRDSPHWRWVTPGGLVGAALWIVASLGFFFYVENFSSYGETYGALAGVVVLILWLYLSSLSILIGAEVNAEAERQSEPTSSGGRHGS